MTYNNKNYLVKAELTLDDSHIINKKLEDILIEKRVNHHCTLLFAEEWDIYKIPIKLKNHINCKLNVIYVSQWDKAVVLLVEDKKILIY